MLRCAQFPGRVSLAILLGLLIAPSYSALAADGTSDLLQRLSQLHARAQALQPAATDECSPMDQARGVCVSRPTALAQLTPSPGMPPSTLPPLTCRVAAGGQCCAEFSGAILCTRAPASGTCPRGTICCSQAQRASGACVVPLPPRPQPSVHSLKWAARAGADGCSHQLHHKFARRHMRAVRTRCRLPWCFGLLQARPRRHLHRDTGGDTAARRLAATDRPSCDRPSSDLHFPHP